MLEKDHCKHRKNYEAASHKLPGKSSLNVSPVLTIMFTTTTMTAMTTMTMAIMMTMATMR